LTTNSKSFQTPETIKKRLLSLYTANFNTYLDTVEAYWTTQSDTITLSDFVQRIIGDISGFQNIKQWPSLAIVSGEMRQEDSKMNAPWGYYSVIIGCRYFLRDSNIETLSKKIDRYGEASLLFLQAYKNLDGLAQQLEIRNIVLTPSDTDELGQSGSEFVKGLQVSFDVRFLAPIMT